MRPDIQLEIQPEIHSESHPETHPDIQPETPLPELQGCRAAGQGCMADGLRFLVAQALRHTREFLSEEVLDTRVRSLLATLAQRSCMQHDAHAAAACSWQAQQTPRERRAPLPPN